VKKTPTLDAEKMGCANDERLAAASIEFATARQARIGRMWERYCVLAVSAGQPRPYPPLSGSWDVKARMLSSALAAGEVSGWWWESALELSDLTRRGGGSLPPPLVLRTPAPTSAMAGSRAKVAELARRAERGEELWHEADGPGVLARGRSC